MTWELSASLIATVLAVGSFLFTYLKFMQERRDRQEDIDRERGLRLEAHRAEEERREKENSDVVVLENLLRDPNPAAPERWWRLRLSGGSAFSRAYVTTSRWRLGSDLTSAGSWVDVVKPARTSGMWLAAGQTAHFKAAHPVTRGPLPDTVSVTLGWTTDPEQSPVS